MSDIPEEVAEQVVEVVETVRNSPVVLAGVGLLGLAVGAAGGYFFAKHQMSKAFETELDEQVEAAKEYYAAETVKKELTPQELAERVGIYQGGPSSVEVKEDAVQTGTLISPAAAAQAREMFGTDPAPAPYNVFDDPTFDYQEEIKHRTAEAPYVITHEEYFAGDRGFENSLMSYFEQDDILVNEQDQPEDDVEGTVGTDNLIRFGAGSRDVSVVYIRNERLELDFEVTKHPGSYLEAIGLGPEPTP